MAYLGKVAIVTGASSGIGRGIAKAFATAGYNLVLCGRNADELNATVELCLSETSEKNQAVPFVGDLTVPGSCQRVVDEAISKFNRIDVLVNNAGMLIPGSALSDLKIEDLNTLMKTNVNSAVELSLCALNHILKTKGCLVNVSSICGVRPMPNRVFYGMSKAAMDMFTKTMALDLAPHGVRVNSVNPGLIPTQIHARTGDPTIANVTQYYEACVPKIPAMRLGTIEEVAETVLFLASDKAAYITGQLLGIDGGLSL
uniref:Uncharacterized protein n=1 Tax=Trichuris muris TaxID=70415 RepID=A0A5S6QH79_TRIMR